MEIKDGKIDIIESRNDRIKKDFITILLAMLIFGVMVLVTCRMIVVSQADDLLKVSVTLLLGMMEGMLLGVTMFAFIRAFIIKEPDNKELLDEKM